MPPMAGGTERAYIGLGANLGNPAAAIESALAAIAGAPGIHLAARSSLYRTAPLGFLDQPDFLNAVAAIDTALQARALMQVLQGIEDKLGRARSFRNAPRTLDLDLLLYGSAQIDLPDLQVPHPRMHERAFVLVPLAEIAPGLVIPGHGAIEPLLAGVAAQKIDRVT
jgi:2-amino-4-hydroxy-6-hydroxymethyldihydropteridine diphosphokinase